MISNFADRLIGAIKAKKSYLCVGLDPQLKYFPPHILRAAAQKANTAFGAAAMAIADYYIEIIDATIEFAPIYKPQMAFYEKYGKNGMAALDSILKHLDINGALVILDGKREDGDASAQAYADAYLGKVDVLNESGELVQADSLFNADALTVTAWIDNPCLKPFVDTAEKYGKGIFVVDRTSFKPVSKFQEMTDVDGTKAWVRMAETLAEMGKGLIGDEGYSSIGAVMGATYPEDAAMMRRALPKAFKLIPGFGYQGGSADGAVACFNEDGLGGIVNNSRVTNYAWHPDFKSEFQCDPKDFATAASKEAKKARDILNAAVAKKNGFLPW